MSPSKVTSPPDVFKEISAEIVTSPVYVCVDEVVTFAPRFDVPDTDNVDRLVAAPSRSKLPVMVNPFVPPARVSTKLTIDAVKVLLSPDNVTPLVYVCVDEVVTSAPRLEVEDTDNEVVLDIAASRFRLPVISI